MRKLIHIGAGAWLSALSLLLTLPLTASAADPLQSITASPSSERINLTAGTPYSGSVKILNTGQSGYDFTVSASPFWVKGEDYDLSYTPRSDLVDASKWFSFTQSRFTTSPGSKTLVNFNIQPPHDIAPGGYYVVVFAETQPTGTTQGITAHKQVGELIYLTVAGNTLKQGSVAGFSVTPVYTEPPLIATLRLTNSGNVHFDATTKVTISDAFGNTKARLESTNTILPKSTRKIQFSWDKAPQFGLFKVTGTVTYLDKTETLPVCYTLMLSSTAFVVVTIAVLLLVGYALIAWRNKRVLSRRH